MPSCPSPHRRALAAGVALAAVVGVTAAVSPAAAATPTLPGVGFAAASRHPASSPVAALAGRTGRIAAFVRLSGSGGLAVAAAAGVRAGRTVSRAAVQAAKAPVAARVSQISGAATQVRVAVRADDPKSSVLYTSRYTVPGVAVFADVAALRRLAANPSVVSVTPLVTRTASDAPGSPAGGATPANAASDAFTQALKVWQDTGRTGAGVHVAVIDTGMDYTHADFGGPGTKAAYEQALASTAAPNPAWYDPEKFLGGYDFAGADYNADSTNPTAYDPYPVPDANPLDGPGGNHGTHVTGTAAGYGVTAQGTTFRGDYRKLDAATLKTMDVGPGAAPGAGVYALKVFGDNGGSTDLTGAALDWIGAAIAGGIRIDVVNLSLGSNYGAPDDPDNAKLKALVAAGVLPVLAAGNAGDLTDVAGSPGNTADALAVAASSSGHVVQDAFSVDAPSALAEKNPWAGQYSLNQSSVGATADVVQPAEDRDGCQAFSSADAAKIAGKIVWLTWTDENRACGSAPRWQNAAAAGAAGVLLTSTDDIFDGGIAGDGDLPGLQMTAKTTNALAPALAAGTLRVTLDPTRAGVRGANNPGLADTLASFSSRGLHGSFDDIVKPDVSAPGESIVSAGNGTGNKSLVLSGTSMASPLVAGIAALVKQAHPTWKASDVKTDVMNSASHDVTTGGRSPIAYAPARAGTGRVDAAAAVTNQVLVASKVDPGLVTGSFGVVEVDRKFVRTLPFTVRNTGSATRSFTLSYRSRSALPGVTYRLSRSSVTVPARGQASFSVTLSVPNAATLRRVLEPTMQATQSGVARQFVPDASGVVHLTARDKGQPSLRVAVFAAPKPVSKTSAGAVTFAKRAATAQLRITGRGVSQGSGTGRYASLLAPMQFGTSDPRESFPAGTAKRTLASVDIRAVGTSSTAPQLRDPSKGMLSFGIQMDGQWGSLVPSSTPSVYIDVNGDGITDFVTTVTFSSDIDQPFATTYDMASGEIVDQRPVNGVAGNVDTNVFDNNVMVLPVSLAALGYTKGTKATTIAYKVATSSYYAPGRTKATPDYTVDSTATVKFDVYRPTVWFGSAARSGNGAALFADRAGYVSVHRRGTALPKLLVLHLQGAAGARSQVVTTRNAGGRTLAGGRAQ